MPQHNASNRTNAQTEINNVENDTISTVSSLNDVMSSADNIEQVQLDSEQDEDKNATTIDNVGSVVSPLASLENGFDTNSTKIDHDGNNVIPLNEQTAGPEGDFGIDTARPSDAIQNNGNAEGQNIDIRDSVAYPENVQLDDDVIINAHQLAHNEYGRPDYNNEKHRRPNHEELNRGDHNGRPDHYKYGYSEYGRPDHDHWNPHYGHGRPDNGPKYGSNYGRPNHVHNIVDDCDYHGKPDYGDSHGRPDYEYEHSSTNYRPSHNKGHGNSHNNNILSFHVSDPNHESYDYRK